MVLSFRSTSGTSRGDGPIIRRRLSPLSALVMVGLMVVFSMWSGMQEQAGAPSRDEQASEQADVSGLIAEGISLVEEERRGGHTLEKHVGKTDEELRARLKSEPWLAVVSTFSDLATAERCVNAALIANAEKIALWTKRGEERDTLAIAYRGNSPIGKSLRRGGKAAVVCTDANIVLRPDRRFGHIVLTAYPEPTRGN